MRLITFGCSLTLGSGLEDVGIRPEHPSKFAWPNVHSTLLGCTLENKAAAGASNKQIQKLVQEYNFVSNDVVVILWSHKDRWCVFDGDFTNQINAWDSDIKSKMFFKFLHNDTDMSMDLHNRIHYVNMYLNNKKIKNFHLYADIMYKNTYKWFDVDMLHTNMAELRHANPPAKYDHHPGIEAHSIFANQVYKEIKEKI